MFFIIYVQIIDTEEVVYFMKYLFKIKFDKQYSMYKFFPFPSYNVFIIKRKPS